ncbi:hypothetical protein MATL_G00003380 [Megalops atlanticus]|uniref:Polycystin-1 n=1 Tax=Megalops atlanticus TaxID=7932 RepID=A0A9D3QGW0_MEGAT|nr:hypothetical protein MATL_G00003380 [Megalops atlanticus]
MRSSGSLGDGRGCSPCPNNCTCSVVGPQNSCVVNCSNIGLDRGPAAVDLPSDTNTLDLSRNRISSVDANLFDRLTSLKELYLQGNRISVLPRGIFRCGTLSVLDLSNNQISTLEERICDKLFNLTEINLSSNPFVCDCKLFRLVNWFQERGVHVRRAESMQCARPPELRNQPLLNISHFTCGLNYAACLPDSHTGRYGGLGAEHECLCSTNSEPNFISESQCSAACADPQVMKECGWTVARDVFPVDFSASFRGPLRFSAHAEAALSVGSSVLPAALSWSFGDLTPLVNTTQPAARHKYALPGSYEARVTLWASNKEITIRGKVRVTLPPILELQCPAVVVANRSIDIGLVNWGGVGVAVDWRILLDGNETAKATPHCPPEGLLHADSGHCFQLMPVESSWAEARRQCSAYGGDLAVVRTEPLRSLLAQRVTQERGVWLGLSDADTPGSLQWTDGSEASEGEGGARDRATLVPGNVCVSLDSAGHASSHPCTTTRAYICEFRPEVRVPDAGVFMVGTAVFNTQRDLSSPSAQLPTPEDPGGPVELLMFPTLGFTQDGRLSSLEFVTRHLSGSVQVRFQVYRPQCQELGLNLQLPGCGELCAPIALCQDQEFNDTTESCPPQQQWCPFQNQCLPLGIPCSPSSCTNCSIPDLLLQEALEYRLVNEVVFTLPPGASRQQLVREGITDVLVSAGDIIALQHDAGPGALLHCDSDPSSPWRQSLFSLNHSNWINGTVDPAGNASWAEDRVCLLRVLYTGRRETSIRGRLLQEGLPTPGTYSFQVTSDDPGFPSRASCPIRVVPPLGLAVVYPPSQNGTLYFRTNHTFLLARVRSSHEAWLGWQGDNQTFRFEPSCPERLSDVVEDEVTSDNLTVQVRVEEPLRNLTVRPDPNHRVLMGTMVSYSATVKEGSNPSFKWTVDDKPHFTYYNTVLNVIYQNAAVYKLSVTAMNHVSSLTEHYNVTVDAMIPMADLTVKGVPAIVTQGSTLNLSASIVVDMSVDATFRWSFGDGGYQVYHFKPPYDSSLLFPDPQGKQVTLQQNINYTYEQPGEYTLTVSVSNKNQNVSQKIDMLVFSVLTVVEIETDPKLLLAGSPAVFEAHPWPSPYGIVYTWSFGDGSTPLQGRERQVNHTFARSGVYNVSVSVNNTISYTSTYAEMLVSEDIRGLTATSSAPTELNTPTVVTAQVEAGNNITWTFDMGDGKVLTVAEPRVEHRYIKDGNYTVNVTAANAISSQWAAIPVQVFVLQVLWLEPSGCIQERSNVSFRAFVSGNSSIYVYEWSFGDGTPNVTHRGTPGITHVFSSSGDYHLSLLLSSHVNKANFFAWVCVQPVVTNVSLVPLSSYTQLGEESKFTVSAFPKFDYTYLWDFGTNDSAVHGNNEMAFTYRSPGQYLVMVTVLNNISFSNNTALIEVQESVGPVVIQHNGTKADNLALHQPYTFTASAGPSKVRYTWEFGDGSVLTGHNVTHAYNVSGVYNICLTGSNEVSSNSSVLSVSVITPIRGLTVNASLINVPLNASVDFEAHLEQGDGVHYSWILCDRCTPIPRSSTMFYTFRSVGTFNIIVTAENDIGSLQASIFIFVQRELEGLQIVADDLVDGYSFATNQVLHLQAVLREGTNMSFTWNLLKDQETAMNLSGRTIDVNFSMPGPCNVVLKATNLLGQITVNRTIEFLDPVGSLSFDATPNPVAVNMSTNMTVAVSGGSDLSYRWSADGRPLAGVGPAIQHRFGNPGLKLVSVEVSNQVSSETISEWISVQEPISGVTFTATEVTEQNFVASGTTVVLQGENQIGTNVSWTWYFPNSIIKMGRQVTCLFPEAGVFTITLNATNDVSAEAVSRDFTVQDKIEGLELKVDKNIVAVRESVEFSINISSGTSVNFVLSISGDSTAVFQNHTYTHKFTSANTYVVNLTAHNQISSQRVSIMVKVMEPISRLTIVNCCEAAIPVGVEKTFIAEIQTGEHVTFLWTFDLHHGAKKTFVAKQVTYTPEEAGQLTIYLGAVNALGCQNVTKVIHVQNILTSASLEAQPQDTFLNKTVSLRASVSPSATPATYQWDFGDGTARQSSVAPGIDHSYSQPGKYAVQVNASNLVSWVVARIDIRIRVLECREPEVQLHAGPRLTVRRSQPHLVEASVDLKGCVRYGVEYLWEIFSIPLLPSQRQARIPLPAEVDTRRLQLSIPKMALELGNYTLVFSLSYKGIPLRKTASLQLSVVAGKLVPIIEGGTYRVWSKTQDLQLSAEQSYDPNLGPDSQKLLTYLWECIHTSKGPSHCSSLKFGLGTDGPVLGIPGSELEADVEYTFRLTISKEGMSKESTTQTVLVQSGRIPMVSLECVSCKAQSIYEVSQSSYVYLAGTCSNCQDSHRGRWTAMTLSNESLVLDSNSTTTGNDGMNLVLRQGVLRDGDSYVFSLHVTDDLMDREGVASIVLRHNLPPTGGSCSLQPDAPQVRTLVDTVHFNCTGYEDSDDQETPLLYSLLVTRCSRSQCEEFCVYKGTCPEHTTYLPPGFRSSGYKVAVSVVIEDHQGAAITALNKSMEVVLPEAPAGFDNLAHWLYHLTGTKLRDLLKQGDPQRVRELCLAIITVLNEYEQITPTAEVAVAERRHRVGVRGNITQALTALDLNTVSDIQQTSAALAQCTAVSREFICEECQNSTLNKLESMLEILQTDTKQGTVTPTEIADNILSIMGDLIHQVSQSPSQPEAEDKLSTLSELHPLRVAAKAYNLSSELMRILMLSRVLNEEPLVLRCTEMTATGKRADPQSLLCYGGSPGCLFSIPPAFNSSLAVVPRVVQLLSQVESNPFPFNFVSNYTVSTEVASMEFQTENGTQIPIASLDNSQAITVAVANNSGADASPDRLLAGAANVSHCSSVIVKVGTRNTNRHAGLHIQLSFSPLDDGIEDMEEDPSISAFLDSSPEPNEYNCSQRKSISLSMLNGLDHKLYTFFVSPESHDTTLDYYVNVTTGCGPRSPGVRLEVGVFSSLCQYFSESDKLWRTDGMLPLAETTAGRAVCSTRHLTSFAASLFVPPNAVQFIPPKPAAGLSLVVLLTCAVALVSYAVAAAILHKLDQVDLRRAAVVPLCGKDGLFKYEVQVKTGWDRGAGTTAHVGISLYGRESRSGHRHLDSSGAFARNSLDIFHISTDTSLGSVWKIRVWHDNKGLSPAWRLQYVLVKDLQTGSCYYFLVEEWLSVDNERTDGRVEIEVEASAEADLRQIPRLLTWELQRAMSESHIWLSLWLRPPRSPFTRLQRATCCAVLLHLALLANAVWHGTVADRTRSPMAVARLAAVSGETVAAGLVSCLAVYPLYLLVLCLFRMARSKVSVEQLPPQVDQESLEIDDFLDNSMAGSSFLILNGIPGETFSEETNIDLPTPSSKSVQRWGIQEREQAGNWPDLLSDPALVGAALPKLKRGQGSRHLGVDMALTPEEEEAGGYSHRNKYFTSSDEDLIKRILADGQLQVSRLCDPQQFFSQTDSEMADLSSIFGDKTEVILLQKLNEPLPAGAVRREPPKTAFTSRTVMADVCRQRRFPPWCGQAALVGSWAVLALSSGLAVWLGLGFSERVALMWLISAISSVAASVLILEPLKVLVEALYFALVVRRLRPEEQDVLVESPRVEHVSQRIPRVRPPQGFALFQAREEARKVRLLHSMLKNFILYMLFLLVVLLINYADLSRDTQRLHLRSQLQHRLHTAEFTNISRPEEVWAWLSHSLLPLLLDRRTLMQETGSLLLGVPRLRQIRAEHACDSVGYFTVGSSWTGCGQLGTAGNSTPGLGWAGLGSGHAQNWTATPPDASGAWHWGQVSIYDNGGYVQDLGRSVKESEAVIQNLQRHHWLDSLSRALFVEFTLYNTNTDLLAVVTFLLEFPAPQGALPSVDLKTCSQHRLSTGLDLHLFLTVVLLVFVVYFCARESAGVRREGRGYFLRPWNVAGLCSLALSLSAAALHLSRAALADRQWASYLRRRHAFTDFYPLAFQSQAFTQLSALLLFLLVLKASHQLRFLREWAVFGRTLRRSAWELTAGAVALLVLLLAYSHAGHLTRSPASPEHLHRGPGGEQETHG